MSESFIYKHKNYSGYAFLSCNLEWINYIGLGFHSALSDFGFCQSWETVRNSFLLEKYLLYNCFSGVKQYCFSA